MKFKLGQLVMTSGVAELDDLENIMSCVARHQRGDWGDVCPEDAQVNEDALAHGHRLLSSYCLPSGTKIWVITEWDRSVTTVLKPEEY